MERRVEGVVAVTDDPLGERVAHAERNTIGADFGAVDLDHLILARRAAGLIELPAEDHLRFANVCRREIHAHDVDAIADVDAGR